MTLQRPNKIFNDTDHRAASLRQLSFMCSLGAMHHHICHHYPLYLIRSGILTQIKAKSLRLLVLRFIIVNRQVSDLLLVWNRTTVNRKHAAWASSEERIRCETKYTGNITRLTREHAAPGPAPTVTLSVSSWRAGNHVWPTACETVVCEHMQLSAGNKIQQLQQQQQQ